MPERSVHIRLGSTHEPGERGGEEGEKEREGKRERGRGSERGSERRVEKRGGDIKTQRLDTCGRVLEVKWMKTVFADVKLWVLGSSALPANSPLEQDERCNVSINCKDGASLFYPVFTYKGPPRRSRVHTLEKAVLTNCIFKKAGEEERKQNRNLEEQKKKKKKSSLTFTGSYLPTPVRPPPATRKIGDLWRLWKRGRGRRLSRGNLSSSSPVVP